MINVRQIIEYHKWINLWQTCD